MGLAGCEVEDQVGCTCRYERSVVVGAWLYAVLLEAREKAGKTEGEVFGVLLLLLLLGVNDGLLRSMRSTLLIWISRVVELLLPEVGIVRSLVLVGYNLQITMHYVGEFFVLVFVRGIEVQVDD